MFENKDAVLFDLDGTLVDSMWVWPEVDIVYLGDMGLEYPETFRKKSREWFHGGCAVLKTEISDP